MVNGYQLGQWIADGFDSHVKGNTTGTYNAAVGLHGLHGLISLPSGQSLSTSIWLRNWVKSTGWIYSFLPVLNEKNFYVPTYRQPLKSLTGDSTASQRYVFLYSSHTIVCIRYEIVIAALTLIIKQ